MPFTLAHPVAVLPLARCRYLHFPALVLGSLSPDFVYFLGGRAAFGIGHTFWGCVLINLPLCFVFYAIYVFLWRDVLRDYLPQIINVDWQKVVFRQPKYFILIFLVSAIIGMITHIFLDDFTHETGYFVRNLPILREIIWHLPLFKWLQYGGGALGLLVCGGFLCVHARKQAQYSPILAQQKIRFWIVFAVYILVLLLIWHILLPISLENVATWVIRIVDCGVISLTFLAWKVRFQAA